MGRMTTGPLAGPTLTRGVKASIRSQDPALLQSSKGATDNVSLACGRMTNPRPP